MQLVATAEQMQQLDSSAINRYSLSGLVLMENAGRAFVDVLEKFKGPLVGVSVVVLCGKGNNGGDGFVIGRHLANRGARVHVALLAKRREVRGDAKTNLDVLLKMVASKKSGIVFEELSQSKIRQLPEPEIIVDAIFGTGFSGRVKGLHKSAIEWANARQEYVAAVDIPSGVNATSGVVENVAIKANLTVTIGLAKIGHFVGDGRSHSGEVVVADISIPRFLFEPTKNSAFRLLADDVKRLLPQRKHTAHKYSVGKVFVLSGSRSYTGAPVMTSQAAMRAGAGLTVLGTPKSIQMAVAQRVAEVIVRPLEETSDGSVALAALPHIRERADWADVIAIGPGLSLNEETREVVLEFVRTSDKPIVLDADGIMFIASDLSVLRKRKHPTILTPHAGEMRKLTGFEADYIETNRVDAARSAAEKLNCVVCLKGSPTVTGTPGGDVYLNTTGNPGMATGGTGDVLTGVIASLVAQGMNPAEAAFCGVFIHGMAGDIAARAFGERSLMALDLLACIPEALNTINVDAR